MWAEGRGTAHARLVRVMAFALGSATIVLFALNAPAIVAGLHLFQPAWTVLTLTAVACSTFTLTVLRKRVAVPTLLRWCAVHALGIIIALGTVPLAVLPGTQHDTPWVVNVLVLGAAAGAVAFRPLYAWTYLACMLVLMVSTTAAVTGAPPWSDPYQDALFNTFYLTLCFALALATHRAGRLLDEAADAAITEARSVAVTTARSIEDGRIQALVHDSVLVALLAFARGSRTHDPAAAEQARRALLAIERAESPEPTVDEPASPRDLVWALQALATDIDPTAAFRAEPLDAPATIPSEVVEALREATGEALRNSLAHAARGPDDSIVRFVVVRATALHVTVDIVDDGRGFDPARVRPGRLGLGVSIFGRMQQLDGGSAVVRANPGGGTRVSLAWSAQ